MSENLIEEKAKITSYFPSNSTPIYKLINQDKIESKSNEVETAYFLETTNSIVSNGYRRLSLKTSTFNYNTNNNAKNLLLPTNNESNDDDSESESDDDYYNEICDESSNLSLTKISNRDKSSEQVIIFVS